MKSFGGFMGIQFGKGEGIYHENANKLNCGRAAFQIFLESNDYSKVLMPKYICEDIFEPIKRTGIDYELYDLNENLMPKVKGIKKGEILLYVNYFGICDKHVEEVLSKYKDVILDCSQAFFYKPPKNIPAIYSPRKFYGVPDGGFLYMKKKINKKINKSTSSNRFIHILKKTENGTDNGFKNFQKNEQLFKKYKPEKMSLLTEMLISSQSHSSVIKARVSNFKHYHSILEKINKFSYLINYSNYICPLSYPFLSSDSKNIKDKLIKKNIFTATYWPTKNVNNKSIQSELNFQNNLIHLPLSQDLTINNLNYIIDELQRAY